MPASGCAHDQTLRKVRTVCLTHLSRFSQEKRGVDLGKVRSHHVSFPYVFLFSVKHIVPEIPEQVHVMAVQTRLNDRPYITAHDFCCNIGIPV